MLQYIGSYIWGEEEDTEPTPEFIPPEDQIEIDNEWIYIPKDEQKKKAHRTEDLDRSNEKTAENSRIEDISVEELMSTEEQERRGEERILEVIKQEPQKPVGQKVLKKRQPLKDLNEKLAVARKRDSPNNLKRNNAVHMRDFSSRKNKQYGRMHGKHTAMVGKRSQGW